MIKFTDLQWTPNQSRVIYDTLLAFIAAGVAWLFCKADLLAAQSNLTIFFIPFLLLLTNFFFGIYTKFKIGSGPIKMGLLTVSLTTTSGIWMVTFGNLPSILFWSLLVWGPLILPRVFLNLNKQVKTNFILSTLKKRGPILVVGGAGYIGTHVVEQLLKADFQVRVLDCLIHGKESMNDFISHPRFELIEGNATDLLKLISSMNGVSAVVHLGGLVGDPACAIDEGFTRHTNVIATRMLKEVAISLGVEKFIFASSCSVYGTNEQIVTELSALNPVSLYAKTKIDSEQELLLCKDENFYATILRFSTVFGHSRRPRFDLVGNLFTAQAMIDGQITVTGKDQWRPFIHVRDLARAIVMVIQTSPNHVRGQIFNVGDKRFNLTIGMVADHIQTIVSKIRPVKIIAKETPSDHRNYAVSFEKIKQILKFEAHTLLEEGIQEIVDVFKKDGYQNYHSPIYSNLEMTKQALPGFYNPVENSKLYRPIAE